MIRVLKYVLCEGVAYQSHGLIFLPATAATSSTQRAPSWRRTTSFSAFDPPGQAEQRSPPEEPTESEIARRNVVVMTYQIQTKV